MMRAAPSSLVLLLLASSLACASTKGSTSAPIAASELGHARGSGSGAETEDRYLLALSSFDRGDYETAAAMFAQLAAELPAEASHDQLRHLLVQHIAWSLLGSHDMGLDASASPDALARTERMLEAYLVHHEQHCADDAAAREDIYALLAEVQLRRDEAALPDAHARLEQLAHDAYASIRGYDPAAGPRKSSSEDTMVRVIEVDTRKIPWASMDNPRVQKFFRSRHDLGDTLTSNPFGPFNPTRVLVRGRIERGAMSKHARTMLADARPRLERCYEDALAQGVPLVVRLDVSLAWEPEAPTQIELGSDHALGVRGELCVAESLRAAEAATPTLAQPVATAMHLTFFVQPERHLTRDYLEPGDGLGVGYKWEVGPPGIESDTDW